MEKIGNWATTICVAAIMCTLIQLLAPKGKSARMLQLVIISFFLCVLILPLEKNMTLSLPKISTGDNDEFSLELEGTLQQQIQQQSELAVQTLCDRYLKNYDIQVQRVEVVMDNQQNSNIYISHVVLYLEKNDLSKTFTVCQLMEAQLGIPVKVEALPENTATKGGNYLWNR